MEPITLREWIISIFIVEFCAFLLCFLALLIHIPIPKANEGRSEYFNNIARKALVYSVAAVIAVSFTLKACGKI